VVNKTYIPFTNKEIILFNKGLKYGLHHKNWISNLALEAEAALPLLPTPEQEHIRYEIAHNLNKLYKQHKRVHSSNSTRGEFRITNQVRKLSNVKAMVNEVDKGSSMIIIRVYESDYNKQVQDFISSNNFELVPRDINKLQHDIKSTIDCIVIFTRQDKWRYTSLNPATPTLKGLIKIHKAESPMFMQGLNFVYVFVVKLHYLILIYF
jgi:hypothetical protein